MIRHPMSRKIQKKTGVYSTKGQLYERPSMEMGLVHRPQLLAYILTYRRKDARLLQECGFLLIYEGSYEARID